MSYDGPASACSAAPAAEDGSSSEFGPIDIGRGRGGGSAGLGGGAGAGGVPRVGDGDAIAAERGGFRLQGRHLFLTYPRCPVERDYAFNWLCALETDAYLDGITVARELHSDGTPHLHACLSYSARRNIVNARHFDLEIGRYVWHPNIVVARSETAVRHYVEKHGDFISDGSHLKPLAAAKQPKLAAIAQSAVSGGSLLDLFKEYPGQFLLHKRKIEELITWYSHQASLMEVFAKHALLGPALASATVDQLAGLNEGEREVLTWLGTNLGEGTVRPFKAKQLYLYGPPNSGKTSLLRIVMMFVPTYIMPTEDFYDLYDEKVHRLVVLDEFRAQKTIQFLNQWSDGQMMSLRKKGSQCLKARNTGLIVCSNFSIREAYSKSDDAHLESILTRFSSIRVSGLWNLIKLLQRLLGLPVDSDEVPADV